MSNRDADFTGNTPEIIGARDGFRCSVPGCDQTTTGPGKGPSDVERIGVACHIFAAARNGPRGTGGLSATDRRSPMNGFWAWEHHGRQIDNYKGKNYPASTLLAWKSLPERRIANELKKVRISVGAWVDP